MDWKKIAPWNWFEDEAPNAPGPARPAPRLAPSGDPITDLRAEMDRLFEDVVRRTFPASPGVGSAPDRERGFAPLRPHVDISEGRTAYRVRVELPGVEREDVSLETREDGRLVLRAEKRLEHEEEDEGYHCVESRYGAVQRILCLPRDADASAIEARFKNGVLKLTIPKRSAPATGAQSIEVQPG